jgi:hypothetical protein
VSLPGLRKVSAKSQAQIAGATGSSEGAFIRIQSGVEPPHSKTLRAVGKQGSCWAWRAEPPWIGSAKPHLTPNPLPHFTWRRGRRFRGRSVRVIRSRRGLDSSEFRGGIIRIQSGVEPPHSKTLRAVGKQGSCWALLWVPHLRAGSTARGYRPSLKLRADRRSPHLPLTLIPKRGAENVRAPWVMRRRAYLRTELDLSGEVRRRKE